MIEWRKISRLLDVLGEETDTPSEGLALLTKTLGALITFYEDDPGFREVLDEMKIEVDIRETEKRVH